MSKKEWKGETIIVLTVDQAKVALSCAEGDIDASRFSEVPDYEDVSLMTFYLRRAELVQRLRTALRAHGEEV
jgi:hypothetical protein